MARLGRRIRSQLVYLETAQPLQIHLGVPARVVPVARSPPEPVEPPVAVEGVHRLSPRYSIYSPFDDRRLDRAQRDEQKRDGTNEAANASMATPQPSRNRVRFRMGVWAGHGMLGDPVSYDLTPQDLAGFCIPSVRSIFLYSVSSTITVFL